MTAVVRADKLTKFYGRERGVVDLDFEVGTGEVFGVLGPNGAGKTTTIRLMLDLVRPTRGRIELFGADPRRDVGVRRRVGYLPGDLRLYERLTARELFTYFAHLRGLPALGAAPALADRLDLTLDRPIRALSKGNRQKVGLVQAFMHRPELLVLDEPTAGLDPLIRRLSTSSSPRRSPTARPSSRSRACARRRHVRDAAATGRLRRSQRRSRARTLRPHRLVLAGRRGRDALVKALGRHRVIALDSHEADLEDIFLSLYHGEEARDAA